MPAAFLVSFAISGKTTMADLTEHDAGSREATLAVDVRYGSIASFRGWARHFRCSFIFGHRCAVCAIAAAVNAAMIEAASTNCGTKRNPSAG
jgi:hypothetical protein